MKVAFTNDAIRDLEDIADHIALDAPKRALSFVRELRVSAVRVGRTPLTFPFAPRFEHLGVRRHVYGNYLILYRIERQRVDILRIVHGARDYGRLLDTAK